MFNKNLFLKNKLEEKVRKEKKIEEFKKKKKWEKRKEEKKGGGSIFVDNILVLQTGKDDD